MNVYDFDHTIYDGDCTLDFWVYCVKHHPIVLLSLPQSLWYAICFKLHCCTREQFKEKFYFFLRYLPDVQSDIKLFWDCNCKKIKSFYLNQADPNDLIISASPDFLIDEICKRLGVCSLSSKVNPVTGKLEGPNCRGEEKVNRFRVEYPEAHIEKAYFDSESDIAIAKEADEPILVEGHRLKKVNLSSPGFEKERELSRSQTSKKFFSKLQREVLLYLVFGGLTFLISVVTFSVLNVAFGMNELTANILSWIIAVVFAFATNRAFVFTSPCEKNVSFWKQMVSFFEVRTVTLLVEEIILLIFVSMLELPSIPIKVAAQVIVIVLNYILSKKIVFR